MADLSDHHINVLIEHKVFGFQVCCIGRDGHGDSVWMHGQRGRYMEPIRDWCTDEELAASIIEKYARRGRSVMGAGPREVCIKALRLEGLDV